MIGRIRGHFCACASHPVQCDVGSGKVVWDSSSIAVCRSLQSTSTVRAADVLEESEEVGEEVLQGLQVLRVEAGARVSFTGIITGDVVVETGGTAWVRGRIDGSVRVHGGTAEIDGLVRGDAQLDGGSLRIQGWVEGCTTNFGGCLQVLG